MLYFLPANQSNFLFSRSCMKTSTSILFLSLSLLIVPCAAMDPNAPSSSEETSNAFIVYIANENAAKFYAEVITEHAGEIKEWHRKQFEQGYFHNNEATLKNNEHAQQLCVVLANVCKTFNAKPKLLNEVPAGTLV